MNSDDLNFFALVADAGSISAAALAVGCDASTLSRKMSQLETEVGGRLFRRSGRGVMLTAQGESLRDYAQQVKALLAQATAAVSTHENVDPLKIRIAAQPTIAKVLFGRLFHAIQERFPNSRIHFSEGLASGIIPGLHAGEIDVALLYRPEYAAGLSYEPLASEQLYLLTPNNFELAKREVGVDDLASLPLILPSTHHGLRVMIDAIASRHGLVPKVVLESDSSIAITMQLVYEGCGCTLLPLAAASQEVAQGRLQAYPIADPELQRQIALVIGKTAIQPNALWALNNLIRDVMRNAIIDGEWPGAQLVGQRAYHASQ